MLNDLSVTNFKSLKDISLRLGPRNVLVGPNMSGKSNLISVFRFLRRMVLSSPGTYGLPTAITAEGGFDQLAWRGGNSDLITISLTGNFPAVEAENPRDWQYRLEIVGDRQRGSIRVQEETLRSSPPGGITELIRKDPGSGRRVLMHPSRGAISEIQDSDRSALEFEIPDWPGNQLRLMFASTLFYKLIPQVMRQANPVGAPAHLDESGANLSSWLMMLQTRHQDQFFRISSAVSDVLPDVARLFTWPTPQSTVFLAANERSLASPVGVSEMSDGELCFIALLSLVFSPEQYGAPLLCIEEPENFLHPKLLHALVDLANQRRRELGEARSAQVIVTTHSPQLLDRLQLEDVIVVDRRDGATQLSRPKDKPDLRELLSREELGLGDLFYSGALGRD